MHADDYLRINGNKVWETSSSNACGGSIQVSSTEFQTSGYTLGSVIPAWTPIRIDLVDTAGIVSGASGKLLITQGSAAAGVTQPSISIISPNVERYIRQDSPMFRNGHYLLINLITLLFILSRKEILQ